MSPPAEQFGHVAMRVSLVNEHAGDGTGTRVQVLHACIDNTAQSVKPLPPALSLCTRVIAAGAVELCETGLHVRKL